MFKLNFFIFSLFLVYSSVQSASKDDNYLLGPIISDDESLEFELTKNSKYGFKDNLQSLHVKVDFLNDYRVRCKIKNGNFSQKRFEAPIQLDLDIQTPNETSRLYEVKLGGRQADSSVLKIIRKQTNTTIWSMDLGKIIFSDQFIRVTNQLTSLKLFGLGEHMDTYLKNFTKQSKTIVLFNRGRLPLPEKFIIWFASCLFEL